MTSSASAVSGVVVTSASLETESSDVLSEMPEYAVAASSTTSSETSVLTILKSGSALPLSETAAYTPRGTKMLMHKKSTVQVMTAF